MSRLDGPQTVGVVVYQDTTLLKFLVSSCFRLNVLEREDGVWSVPLALRTVKSQTHQEGSISRGEGGISKHHETRRTTD